MIVTEVAEINLAYLAGELAAMVVIPIAGAVLLVVGLRRRSRGQQQPPPNYSPSEPNPYGPPQYHPTPAPSSARSSTAMIVVGLLVLVAGLAGIASRAMGQLSPRPHESTSSLKVGECVSQSNLSAKNMSPTIQSCDSSDSTLEVASTGGGSAACPDGKLRDSQYAVLFDKSTTLCFLLNLKQGQCYSVEGDSENPVFVESACEGTMPLVKVVARIDGDYDRSHCPDGTNAVSYLKPARLYCLQPLTN